MTLAFDSDGKLGLSLTSLPSANQFLTKDTNGRLSWGSPAVTTLQGQTIAAAAPSSGQVLTFNGGQWVPTTLTSSGSGTQTAGNYLTALTGDVVATGPGSSTAILASVALPGTATKVTFDVKGRVTAGTSLTSADITTALGYAPLNTAALSNGQILIGSTGTAPVPASLSSGANAGVTVTTDAGSITLDTAQDIRPTASPTFATVNAATLASATYIAGTADNSASPTAGMLRAANAVGSDAVGANLVLASGNGTGTGGSGSISFNTAAADATGATANTLATRMTITPSGNVGIGTTSPGSKLHVNGNVAIGYSTSTAGPTNGLAVSGNVGIGTTSPTQRLQVGTSGAGTVALANAWNTLSDIRLKRDLTVIPDALDKLLELHGYYYFWKDGSDQTRQVGVVAQEVEKILPELVHTGSDGIKTVDYPKLTAVLIEGTKQLKAEKDSEIAQLKARADAAESEAALLKRALCDKFSDLAVCSH